jgi:hypothetical protein
VRLSGFYPDYEEDAVPLTTCQHPDCREPHGRAAYVTFDGSERTYCLGCFLGRIIELDPEIVADVEDEAEMTNSLISLSNHNNS